MAARDDPPGFGESQGADSRFPQIANVYALGSVILEGAPPVSPVLPLMDRSKIIEGGEPNLFYALSWNYGLTRFQGREEALATILDWALDDEPVSVRLISGPGGVGKTRMASEAVQALRKQNWTAGFLPTEAISGRLLQGTGGAGLFLVVDYPEERRKIVDDLIKALAETADAPKPIRVLLLSRQGFGDWDGYATQLKHRFGRQELVRPQPLSARAALAVLTDAAEGLSHLMGQPAPALEGAVAWLSPTPDDPERRLPLFAAAAGLHAVMQPKEAFELGGAALMKDLARRELNRVNRASLPLGLRRAESKPEQDGLARLLALGTTGGAGLDAATVLALQADLNVVPGRGGEEVLEALQATSWWRQGAADNTWRLAPLTPDRLAAAFVSRVLLDQPHPTLPEQHWFAARGAGEGYGNTISRLGFDLNALADGATARFETMLLQMLDTAPERAATFEALGYRQGTAFSAGFSARVLELLREGTTDPKQLAGLLNNLANFLSALGRPEEALAAAQEAVDLYRSLAAARPDAFTPDLAMSLNNLANRLSALGRREEALAAAQAAVDLRRSLAAARPDAFTPNLAMSVSVLSDRLRDLGDHAACSTACLEAADLLAPFAAQHPAAHAGLLAQILKDYIAACAALETEPDAERLAPFVTILQAAQPKE